MRTRVTLTVETSETDPEDYARALMEAADDAARILRYRGVTMTGGDLNTDKDSSFSAKVERV